jgi:hypothetical protein
MRRACSTMTLAAALLAFSSASLDAQTPAGGQLRSAPTFTGRAGAPPPDRVNLISLENRLGGFEGMYVHMSTVEIHRVLSPRLFTVRRPLMPRHEALDAGAEVLLLLDAPLPALTRGTRIQVTGWVTTVSSATPVMGGDWGVERDDDYLEDMNRPLVIANVVRTLDGRELASRQ